MVWFIVGLLFVVAGAILIVKHQIELDRETISIRWVGVIALIVGLFTIALDSVTTVPTRNIAVQTEFGKPVGTLGNGFHIVAPWSTTEDFDATVQTLKLSGDSDDNGEPITVRLANNVSSKVDVTAQWQVDPNADITGLYLDYRHFDQLDTNVVRRLLSAALNEVFEGYDPLVGLEGGQGALPKKRSELATQAQNLLAARLPAGIHIRSVLIPNIVFPQAVQDKIDQYVAAVAETQIATQRQKTAEALATANNKLATANNTPGVLFQNCLDLVERMTKDGKVLPPAFSCGAPPGFVIPLK